MSRFTASTLLALTLAASLLLLPGRASAAGDDDDSGWGDDDSAGGDPPAPPPQAPRLWAAVSSMDVLAAARTCAAEPGCTEFEPPPELELDETTGQPLLPGSALVPFKR